jgi:hypothetical protein
LDSPQQAFSADPGSSPRRRAPPLPSGDATRYGTDLQGRAANGESETIGVIWEDHRRSRTVPEPTSFTDRFPVSSNLNYDIYGTTVDAHGHRSPNKRVTSRSSISDFIFVGDYNDLTATGGQRLFGIWTDRRHQSSTGASLDPAGNLVIDEAAFEDNVFGAPVRPARHDG